MLALLPMGLMAQELKIAIVNVGKVHEIMPEVKQFMAEMEAAQKELENELSKLKNEYEVKIADLTAKGDSLSDNIKQWRTAEIVELQQKIETLYNSAPKILEDREQELIAPIQEKINKAIQEVGEENGYTYILRPEALLYVSPAAIDATDKVIAKLGLK